MFGLLGDIIGIRIVKKEGRKDQYYLDVDYQKLLGFTTGFSICYYLGYRALSRKDDQLMLTNGGLNESGGLSAASGSSSSSGPKTTTMPTNELPSLSSFTCGVLAATGRFIFDNIMYIPLSDFLTLLGSRKVKSVTYINPEDVLKPSGNVQKSIANGSATTLAIPPTVSSQAVADAGQYGVLEFTVERSADIIRDTTFALKNEIPLSSSTAAAASSKNMMALSEVAAQDMKILQAQPIQTFRTLMVPGCHEQVFSQLAEAKNTNFSHLIHSAAAASSAKPRYGRFAGGSGGLNILGVKLPWDVVQTLTIDILSVSISLAVLYYFTAGQHTDHFDQAPKQVELEAEGITFDDVAGFEKEKQEMQEIIDYLLEPESFQRLGAVPPTGMLLVGAPGCGKTLLAKALASQAKVPFLYASASSFVEKYVGTGSARVRKFFVDARVAAPCICFLDELEAIGTREGYQNAEYVQTISQLLTELDGMNTRCRTTNVTARGPKPWVFLAATNQYHKLDKAICRPGRLDRIVFVDFPDLKARVECLKIHSKKIECPNFTSIEMQKLGLQLEGWSCAEIAQLVNDSALIAARAGKKEVRYEDFLPGMEQVKPRDALLDEWDAKYRDMRRRPDENWEDAHSEPVDPSQSNSSRPKCTNSDASKYPLGINQQIDPKNLMQDAMRICRLVEQMNRQNQPQRRRDEDNDLFTTG